MIGLPALTVLSRLLPLKVWAAVGIVLALIAGGIALDQRGYSRGFETSDALWVEQVREEQVRQAAANEEAARRAEISVARLNEQVRIRNETIERLTEEAARDGNANNVAIGADSVLRLNSVH